MNISEISSFQEQMQQLRAERRGNITLPRQRQLSVTILGAGPAGLIRAIESIMDNHKTLVIERRAAEEGRVNTVALNKETMPILKKYGIYQWLLENNLVFPYNEEARPYLSVRLKDLERAMKAVIQELAPEEQIIQYESTIKQISIANPKVAIQLQTGQWVRDIDLLVNGEGSRSSTNALLQIGRREVLEKVPVIAAIFEDTRPKITGVGSFFVYIGKSIVQSMVSIYYYAIFFFKFIFQGERFWNPDRTIAGSLILKTPGQNYLGCGFSKEHSKELLALQKQVEDIRQELEQNDTPEMREQLVNAEAEFNAFASYWINLSFCAANVLAFLIKCAKCLCCNVREVQLETAGRFPLKNFKMIEIGADRAVESERRMRESAYLLCGDALATVDPTTGLGANTAIGKVDCFREVMYGMRRKRNLQTLLDEHRDSMNAKVSSIHSESRALRAQYRPDAY